jgi:ABC-type transport system involved in Fe-S cluster assembly fused permease/ATPase subunit
MNATFEQIEKRPEKLICTIRSWIYPMVIITMLPTFRRQQRIAIARLFLKNPPIIFLDEPTASLDAIATEQIKNSLDAIKAGRTVIIISHSLSQILDSDTIYVMKKGR